jgi:hypothetical protein
MVAGKRTIRWLDSERFRGAGDKQCSGSGSLDPYTGLRTRLRIWILLFLPGSFEMATKTKITSHKEVTKQLKSRFFSFYLLVDGRIRFLIRILEA